MEREVLLEIKNLTTEFITEEGHLTKAVDGISLSLDRKSTRLNSSHSQQSRMPSSA